MPEELWTELHDIVQEAVIKTIPKKKKCRKAKWLSEEASQTAEKRREAKGKGEKRYIHLNAEFQRIARRDKKAFLSEQCREIEENNRMGKIRDLWFQIGKGVCQGCILSTCLFNLYAEYIMRNVGLDEAQAGIKIARRNINNLRYADDTTLVAESE